ncbi:hypothetical protein Leryth_022015 [Lithospermum erythrorhizon]|nr:hypothetical protein Leryth_022015 [Lithospermum erythrorhizon]
MSSSFRPKRSTGSCTRSSFGMGSASRMALMKKMSASYHSSRCQIPQCSTRVLGTFGYHAPDPPPHLLYLIMAAVAALCVQYEADFRPNMSIVVKALQPLLNTRLGGADSQA